jgi:hypothetical protein
LLSEFFFIEYKTMRRFLKEATTPFVPATDVERQEILPRLQQILTARVAIAELPIQVTNVTISM